MSIRRRNGEPGRSRYHRFRLGFLIIGLFSGLSMRNACATHIVTEMVRRWTIPDIVEIKRIIGTAVQGSGEVAAFILEEPKLGDDQSHYELFEVSPGREPRLLARANFMSGIEWRPGTRDWTVTADFGDGVQLYEISEKETKPLLVVKPLVLVGGYEGLLRDNAGKPTLMGVLSYDWAPNGRYYWYTRVRVRNAAEQGSRRYGVIYDDADMLGAEPSDFRRFIEYAGTELHVVDILTGADRLIGFDSHAMWREDSFSASTAWVGPSVLQYCVNADPYGVRPFAVWRLNIQTGSRQRVDLPGGMSIWTSVPSPRGFFVAKQAGHGRGIYEITPKGRVIRDLAVTNYRHLDIIPGSGIQRGGTWTGADQRTRIFAVSRSNWLAHGLVFTPSTRATDRIEAVQDTMNQCSFNTQLTWGVCNRESLAKAPELVSVYPGAGRIEVLVRPNLRYDEIAPLRTVARRWRNRFGYINTGYVTFPIDYVPGRRYPAVLVTHALDATNMFAWRGFQWAFPLQVFAEEGYFVLSVDEPRPSPHAAPLPYVHSAAESSIRALWFANSINPMASLEAAVDSLVASGQVDAHEIGILGYSHGAETISFSISHSHVFQAASISDDSWWEAGGYWGGEAIDRYAYDHLFGGAPFDQQAYPNYLRYSPSARIGDIDCPVLQEFSGYWAHQALELNELFLHAKIPTELVVYPHEAHILYGPRDSAKAMQRNLDWFNYWLLGHRNSEPADPGEYRQWDKMALRWKACKADCRQKLQLRSP